MGPDTGFQDRKKYILKRQKMYIPGNLNGTLSIQWTCQLAINKIYLNSRKCLWSYKCEMSSKRSWRCMLQKNKENMGFNSCTKDLLSSPLPFTPLPFFQTSIKKQWYIYSLEYYSAIKKNEILFSTKWSQLYTSEIHKCSVK